MRGWCGCLKQAVDALQVCLSPAKTGSTTPSSGRNQNNPRRNRKLTTTGQTAVASVGSRITRASLLFPGVCRCVCFRKQTGKVCFQTMDVSFHRGVMFNRTSIRMENSALAD